ncbi:MAG TPA: HEAT repeat domain-containing protein, partial [Polyangia bacterium]|nr:HEAT repeat domain-containing protein [Polyangia bacterium]
MRAPRIHRGGVAFAVVFALASAAPAWAARAGKKPNSTDNSAAAPEAAGLPAAEIEALRQALIGPDDEAATEAAAKLGDARTPRAAEPLLEVLAEGGRAVRVQAVLDAFAKLGEAHVLRPDQAVIDALTLYAGHRAPDVRRRAVKALAGVSDPHVTATLVERLGDAAPDVRAAAADALAARHESKAVPRLYALLS